MCKSITKIFLAFLVLTSLFAADVSLAAVSKSEHVERAQSLDKQATKIVNINIADATTIATLKGIGPKKTAAIVAYREKNGTFKSLEDLTKVKGISDKMLARIQKNNPDKITLK